MRARRVAVLSRRAAMLRGYRLAFNKLARDAGGSGRANIMPVGSGVVEGVLYEITAEGLAILDDHEGIPRQYRRLEIGVEIEDGAEHRAVTYVAHPEWIRENLRPAAGYLQHLLEAADVLSENYLETLKRWDR